MKEKKTGLILVLFAIALSIILTTFMIDNTYEFEDNKSTQETKIIYETVEESTELVESETEELTEFSTEEETTEESTEEPTTEEPTTVDIYQIKIEEMQNELAELSSITNKREWFVGYKELLSKYSEWIDPPLGVYDLYTEEEIWYMWRCIETEVYQRDFESRCNVASVIINRIGDSWFGSNAVEVVTKKDQFAYFRTEISEETKLALEYVVLFGDTTNGAIFFNSHDVPEMVFWGANYMFTDTAGHHFYK